MFEIRELRHLLSIEEFRHFGRAAKAVGMSQPALTKSLQRIERSLGAKLFERSRHRVSPTAVGEEVLARARRLVQEAEQLQRAVDAMTGAETGCYRRKPHQAEWQRANWPASIQSSTSVSTVAVV